MKHLIHLILLIEFIFPAKLMAQEFSVESFRQLPNDVSAFINVVYDLNDDACALVKVVAPSDFAFSTPLGIVKRKDEVGEIWLYIPKGSRMLTLKHPEWGVLRDYKFEKVSPLLGPTKMTVTVINAGTQHNVVPDTCTMLVDVRTNEKYTNHEVFDIISHHLSSEVKAHSFRLHSSHIAEDHPLVKRCKSLGLQPFGSPTLSDQALMPWQSLKLGPGSSCRSHSADEYICISEIRSAIETYVSLLEGLEM